MSLLVLTKLPWQIWFASGLLVSLTLGALYIDHRAYHRGFAEADAQWAERVNTEADRQLEANRAALEAAEAEIARLTRERSERDAEIARLIEEARQDPDADRPAIGLDSVRRLNSVD